LQNLLPSRQQKTLFLFLDTLRAVLAESHDPEDLQQLKVTLKTALALLEKDFPVSIKDAHFV